MQILRYQAVQVDEEMKDHEETLMRSCYVWQLTGVYL